MTIPQELLDQIVDELHDDCLSLAACSASSPRLHRQASVHLFADVSLNPRFIQLASTSPHILAYVRTLHLDGKDDHYLLTTAPILRQLHNVRDLHVHSAFLCRFMQRALFALPLHSLHLDGVHFSRSDDLMVALISISSTLRYLRIGALLSPTSTRLAAGCLDLEELCVDMDKNGSGMVFRMPLSAQMLRVNGCSAYDVATINGVLARCPSRRPRRFVVGPSHLCTSFQRTFWMGPSAAAAVGMMPMDVGAVQQLEITVGDCYSELQWWVDTFKALSGRSEVRLRNVCVRLVVGKGERGQGLSWLQPARWVALAETVRSVGSVERVTIEIGEALWNTFPKQVVQGEDTLIQFRLVK